MSLSKFLQSSSKVECLWCTSFFLSLLCGTVIELGMVVANMSWASLYIYVHMHVCLYIVAGTAFLWGAGAFLCRLLPLTSLLNLNIPEVHSLMLLEIFLLALESIWKHWYDQVLLESYGIGGSVFLSNFWHLGYWITLVWLCLSSDDLILI